MPAFDVLIVNARVVDGTGNPWFYGEVALSGDRIGAVAPPGRIPRENAAEVVDGAGRVVCPGFIDIQSHSLYPLYEDGRAISKVAQGVTTEILGELWTPAPFGGRRKAPFTSPDISSELQEEARGWRRFADWLAGYEKRGVAVNVGSFVGGATVREWACGWDAGDPTPEQVAEMRRVTAEAMEDGAFGIAPALIYPPSSYSPDSELTACAEVVGRYGGLYIVHLRSEGDGFLESIEATTRLSREASCPVEIYHFKASGERNWHKIPLAIAAVDSARAAGVDVTADMYPYVASGTGLNVLVPDWAFEGGKLFENLRDPATRARIHAEMTAPQASTGDFASSSRGDHVVPLGFKLPEHRGYVGRTLTEIAIEREQDWADATLDLLVAENQRIATVFFSMNEDNIRLQLQQPWMKVSSDAGGLNPVGQTNPVHPRAYGTYPRVLGKYVRDEAVLTLEDAIRKMTGAVADRLRLRDRGQLRAGFYADVVLLDPATVADRATFTDPHQLAVGIEGVWVNGVRVWKNAAHTDALPGRAIHGGGRRG
jgi:N-acyl-D-amino-acid deacylase